MAITAAVENVGTLSNLRSERGSGTPTKILAFSNDALRAASSVITGYLPCPMYFRARCIRVDPGPQPLRPSFRRSISCSWLDKQTQPVVAATVASTPKFETGTGSTMALGGVFRSVVKRATGGRPVRRTKMIRVWLQ